MRILLVAFSYAALLWGNCGGKLAFLYVPIMEVHVIFLDPYQEKSGGPFGGPLGQFHVILQRAAVAW